MNAVTTMNITDDGYSNAMPLQRKFKLSNVCMHVCKYDYIAVSTRTLTPMSISNVGIQC